MERNVRLVAIIAGIVWALTLLVGGLGACAADCEKAKAAYDKGVRSDNYEERIRAFRKAVQLCPSYAEAHVNLADAYENLGRVGKKFSKESLKINNALLEKAIAEYKLAVNYKPNLFEGYLGQAENYFRMGLYRKAGTAFKKALQVNPGHALAQRAQSGLEAASKSLSQDTGGFKTAKQIIASVKQTGTNQQFGKIMGFENYTAASTRQRFNNILFNTMSHTLDRPEALAQLKEIGEALSSKDLAHCKFIIEGHTDSRGGYDMNMHLSDRRAGSVVQRLIEQYGIDSTRITSQGFGYTRPRVPNDSMDNMLKNRRVELIIIQ